MDGEDAHASGLVALDGLAAECLIPFGEEGADVSGILIDVVHELVVEGTDIGTLVSEAFKAEDGVEAFCEVVEGKGTEVGEVGDIGLGEESVEVRGGRREKGGGLGVVMKCRHTQQVDAVAKVVLEDVLMVTLGDGGFRQLVVRADEQSHGVDEQTDGVGGIETEGLVGNYSHLGLLLHKVLGDEGNDSIGAYENGYLLLGGASLKKFADGFCQALEHLCLIILSRQELDADVSFVGPLLWYLLHHIGIGPAQLIGFGLIDLL